MVTSLTYLGVFFVTLATLMFEILMTRIFSVTMWYHFAFMAISIAMFGMTVGSIIVFLFPRFFSAERARRHLAVNALLFGISSIVSILLHVMRPIIMENNMAGYLSVGLTYVVVSIPFIFSGICICLVLTKFPRQVSKLYAVDLAGAAAGCILLILTLKIMDGLTAVFMVALLACLGAVLFAYDARMRWMRNLSFATLVVLIGLVATGTYYTHTKKPLLQIKWWKGTNVERPKPIFESWNSFSYISVSGDPNNPRDPFGWGISRKYPPGRKVNELWLQIDNMAGTPLTRFDGDVSKLEHLKWDVVNMAHYIRSDSKVLVIGVGGGRDLLSALAFGQPAVTGIEMNEDILRADNDTFGDFTGHLDKNPKITLINDEARSRVTRSRDVYDIIQVSLIDTFAATAAGAFVLSENSLYTTEAWGTFLNHLSPKGVLTFSRWYFKDFPGEVYRLASLARQSLAEAGIKDAGSHIMIVKTRDWVWGRDTPDGIGTILVSKTPFTPADIDRVEQVAAKMDFDVVYTPRRTIDPKFDEIIKTPDFPAYLAAFPINITPPTDESPFYFNMLRLRDLVHRSKYWNQGIMSHNMKAVVLLVALLFQVILLTGLCIMVPLFWKLGRRALKGSASLLIYFGAIGMGFMLVEVSQMQRLNMFLGHPVYGLSVALFSLLLSSGLGSFTTSRLTPERLRGAGTVRILALLAILAAIGLGGPWLMQALQAQTTLVRIAAAVALLFPAGFFMGMAFPIGMKLAAERAELLAPWLWGVNGATSVCASVLAVIIALDQGISVAYWTGVAFYVLCLGAFLRKA